MGIGAEAGATAVAFGAGAPVVVGGVPYRARVGALDREGDRLVVADLVRDEDDAVGALDDLVDRAVALLDLLVLAVMRRATPPCPEHMPLVVLAVE